LLWHQEEIEAATLKHKEARKTITTAEPTQIAARGSPRVTTTICMDEIINAHKVSILGRLKVMAVSWRPKRLLSALERNQDYTKILLINLQ
jgi:hypothetical protein